MIFLHILTDHLVMYSTVLVRLLQLFNLIFFHFLGLRNAAVKRDEVVMLREE